MMDQRTTLPADAPRTEDSVQSLFDACASAHGRATNLEEAIAELFSIMLPQLAEGGKGNPNDAAEDVPISPIARSRVAVEGLASRMARMTDDIRTLTGNLR